ncbi:MAG: BCAM0308 family protein [Desulfuromonadaceae bacterium]|nr:BCAM0308 family protein [Desulfuromonadaceae bacterium]MDD2849927.1 BCAM0308 family protein [Desulfuromonadaceae bacterium]MDD4131714.1 BCAM0308 family protein [Desulfuromonadaceae bacterium]
MVTTIRKTEEKGQRTPRSLDVYKESGGVKGGGYCGCGAVFSNKRWRYGEKDEVPAGGQALVCPACRRIADQNPAGIVALSGSYFTEHKAEIDNQINNTAHGAARKNPLGRVMDTSFEKESVIIKTTDAKLAEKIGREVFRSHAGELNITWSDADSPVRVNWSR